ncbi:MAG: hypothetical protein JWR67_3329 [Mucilaginibacter sp.]|nr:hypothetical protein [Mucilaginibacter sp.]MDB5112215.1 hypothetical protein [Mucilaginibacter sp.]
MIPISINTKTCFFSVKHITQEHDIKFIYGISLNTHNYFISKSVNINDCEQLDNNPVLDIELLNEICEVITELEIRYQKRPSLEFMNKEIFKILGRRRNPNLIRS